jgi:hypothetical protein
VVRALVSIPINRICTALLFYSIEKENEEIVEANTAEPAAISSLIDFDTELTDHTPSMDSGSQESVFKGPEQNLVDIFRAHQ